MDKPLHAKKIEILSRLVKDNHINLEEALLLLKDETPEENKVDFVPPLQPFNQPISPLIWQNPYYYSDSTPSVLKVGIGSAGVNVSGNPNLTITTN